MSKQWRSVITSEIDFDAVRYSRALSVALGEAEAIFIGQLEYLISISNTPKTNGRFWVYKTLKDLRREMFPSWSLSKVCRIKNKLVMEGYVLQNKFNTLIYIDTRGKVYRDRTNWYTLDLEKIGSLPGVFVTSLVVQKTRCSK